MAATTNHIMIDIETLGNSRATAPIISIAAVAFDTETYEIDRDNGFHVAIDLDSIMSFGNIVESGTLVWWLNDSTKTKTLKGILGNVSKLPATDAFEQFEEWLVKQRPVSRYWARGSDFDFALLDVNARKILGRSLISRFWDQRDVRTFIEALEFSLGTVIEVPREGTHHDAFDDVVHQSRHVLEYIKLLKESEQK